jgi:hypothetical protein
MSIRNLGKRSCILTDLLRIAAKTQKMNCWSVRNLLAALMRLKRSDFAK